jgi:hypothetical protein
MLAHLLLDLAGTSEGTVDFTHVGCGKKPGKGAAKGRIGHEVESDWCGCQE